MCSLQTLLSGRNAEASASLLQLFESESCKSNPHGLVLRTIKNMGEKFQKAFEEEMKQSKDLPISVALELRVYAERLYYVGLERIVIEEGSRLPEKFDYSTILELELFHEVLFACCLQIVMFSYCSGMAKFHWILRIYNLEPINFYYITEVFLRAESRFPSSVVEHLKLVEDQVVDSLVWKSCSDLWNLVKESGLPIPSCQDVFLADQIEGGIPAIFDGLSTPVKHATTSQYDDNTPKRTGLLRLFFRKFYLLASLRLRLLCKKLHITDDEIVQKIWTCFEYCVVQQSQLIKDRHLDQILMCSTFSMTKATAYEKTFWEIRGCYREQKHAESHIHRSVLLFINENGVEERGDILEFYNTCFVPAIKTFAKRFNDQHRSRERVQMSPLPKKSRSQSPRMRVARNFTISPMKSTRTPMSPLNPRFYTFNRSPPEDLKAINDMIKQHIDIAKEGTRKNLRNLDTENCGERKRLCTGAIRRLNDVLNDRIAPNSI